MSVEDVFFSQYGFYLKFNLENVEHFKATDLTLVGLQVWRGALLLADYIFHKRDEFKDKRVLELGSGVGLTGLVL